MIQASVNKMRWSGKLVQQALGSMLGILKQEVNINGSSILVPSIKRQASLDIQGVQEMLCFFPNPLQSTLHTYSGFKKNTIFPKHPVYWLCVSLVFTIACFLSGFGFVYRPFLRAFVNVCVLFLREYAEEVRSFEFASSILREGFIQVHLICSILKKKLSGVCIFKRQIAIDSSIVSQVYRQIVRKINLRVQRLSF